MRLIDADAFRFIVADAQIQCDKQIMDVATTLGVVKEVLDEQPTIDAVEVGPRWTEKGKTMENEVKCPECGGEPEVLYVNKAGEIVGCEFCLKAKYWFEVEV